MLKKLWLFTTHYATEKNLVAAFYLLSFAFFLCPAYSVYLVVFYALLLPCGVVLLIQRRPVWLSHSTLLTVYLFLAYAAVTILPHFLKDPKWCTELMEKTVMTILFLWIAILFFLQDNTRARFWTISLLWIVPAALISLIKYVVWDYSEGRFEPLAQAHHPILGAIIYGLFGLFAFDRLVDAKKPKERLWYGGAVAIILLLVIVSQSKGPIIAVAISYTLLALLRDKIALILLPVIALMAVILSHFIQTDYIASIKERGASYRPQIWAYTWQQIKEKPIFGYGLAQKFSYTTEKGAVVPHPHSLYLATLYYTGIIGLILELLMMLALLRGIWRDPDKQWRKFALVLMLYLQLAMASDVVRLITGPKELQFIFWLPFAMFTARQIRRERENGRML